MKRLVPLLLVVVFVSMTPCARAQSDGERGAERGGDLTLTFDVAFDGRLFSNQEGNNLPPDFARGNTFIEIGKIFPGNTIPSGQATNSPDDPGSLGDFFCRGTFIHSLSEILAGEPLEVCTNQFFTFDDGRGLTTEGLEGSIPTNRPVTGGMGSLAGATGEERVERLGTNATGDFNIRVTFTIKRKSIK